MKNSCWQLEKQLLTVLKTAVDSMQILKQHKYLTKQLSQHFFSVLISPVCIFLHLVWKIPRVTRTGFWSRVMHLLNHLVDVGNGRATRVCRACCIIRWSTPSSSHSSVFRPCWLQRVQRSAAAVTTAGRQTGRRLQRTVEQGGTRIGLITRRRRVEFRVLIVGGGGIGLEGVEGGGLGHGR